MKTLEGPGRWLGLLAVAGLVAGAVALQNASVVADEAEEEGRIVKITPNNDPVRVETEEAEADAEPAYWIGIQGAPINSDVLRTHLQLGSDVGVVVERVMPDSPAFKAGLRKHDILIGVNKESVGDLSLLQQAVAEGRGKPIDLKVIRLAKEEKITVTPEERPADLAQFAPQGAPGRMQGMVPGLEGQLGDLFSQFDGGDGQFRMFGRGPGGQGFGLQGVPEGVKVSVTREGDGPATITVEKGDQKWTVTEGDEEALAELPEEIRPLVTQLLEGDGAPGLGNFDLQRHFNFPLPEGAGRVQAEQQLNARQKETMKRMMRQMKELEQRMEQMQRELHEGLPTAPAPVDDPSKT
jgi:membrane-associated protease RseP (regulator of RpoE activity)